MQNLKENTKYLFLCEEVHYNIYYFYIIILLFHVNISQYLTGTSNTLPWKHKFIKMPRSHLNALSGFSLYPLYIYSIVGLVVINEE